MTERPDLERRVADHLAVEAPTRAPAWVLASALATIDTTRQRHAIRVPWRIPHMPNVIKIALLVAIIGIVAAGALIIGSPPSDTLDPDDGAVVTPVDPEPLGADPQGIWQASRTAAFGLPDGDYTMEISSVPALTVTGPDDRLVLLGAREDLADGEVWLGATDRCASAGTYAWSVSADFRTLAVSLGTDDCLDRSTILVGDWHRDGIGHRLVPERPYRADMARPVIFTVPTGFMVTGSGEPPSAGIVWPDMVVVDADDHWAFIQTSGEILADRCDQDMGMRPPVASLEEFIGWNRGASGVEVSEPVTTTVAGLDAVRLDVSGSSACQHAAEPADCGNCMYPGYVAGDGFIERTWGVDLGDGHVAIIGYHDDDAPFLGLTPERAAIAQRLVDSIRFP